MTTVVMMAGSGGDPNNMPRFLNGSVTNGNTLLPVTYASEDWLYGYQSAAKHLDVALKTITPGEQIIVFTHSYGSVGADYWLKNYQPFIDPALIDFILLGDSVGPNGVMDSEYGNALPDDAAVPYRVIRGVVRYDYWADYPNVHSAFWRAAIQNVQAGKAAGINEHAHGYDTITLASPHWETVNGNVTHVLWPTDPLITTASLEQIETAYNRVVDITQPLTT